MKKTTLFLLFCCFTIHLAYAQQLFFEVFSGVNATAYEPASFDQTQWYVPIGVRLAGGHEHVQVGFEYRENITHPVFEGTFNKTEFEETYKGIFLRGNISSLPAYRFGLVLKAGTGYYQAVQNDYLLNTEELSGKLEFERALGYNLGIGVSSPIHSIVHWEIGYQFNLVDRPDAGLLEGYSASYHSFQLGLSINLVFGNTAKKCRRVIGGNRSKRGW